jgi:hypothetical protein
VGDTGFSAAAASQLEYEALAAIADMERLGLPFSGGCAYQRGEFFYNNAQTPVGPGNGNALPIVERIFSYGRTIWERCDESLPVPDAMTLRCTSVQRTDTPASILALVDEAIAERRWLILTFHTIAAPGETGTGGTFPNPLTSSEHYATADFTTILDGLVTRRAAGTLSIDRVGVVLRKTGGPLAYDPGGLLNRIC